MSKKKAGHTGLVWQVLFSLAFGLALSLTMEIHYNNNIWAGMAENYLSVTWITVMRGIGFSVLTAGAVRGLSLLSSYRFPESSAGGKWRELSSTAFFLLVWGIMLICWMPYLLTFYPGSVVGDGAEALEYVIDQTRMDARWGAAFILVLRGFAALGKLLSPDINVGLFLYTLCSFLLYSAACSAVVTTLRKKGVPVAGLVLCIFLYAVSGHYAAFAIGFWKDGLFGAGIALLSLLLWDEPEERKPGGRWIAKTGSLLVFLCLWRNAVAWGVMAAGVAIWLVSKRKKRRIAILLAVIGIVMILVQGPIYMFLGFTGTGAAETVAIPLQQVAASVSEGASLNEWQSTVLFSMMPEEVWISKYAPAISDSIKFSVDDAVMKEKMADFLKVWLQLMPANLETYIRAHLMETLGFWQVYGSNKGIYYDWFLGIQDLYGRGYTGRDLLFETTGYTMRESLLQRAAFIPSGTMGWILLLSITLVMGQRKERKKKMAVLAPYLFCWIAVLAVAPIAYSYRYIEMLAIGLPVIVCMPWIRVEELNPSVFRIPRVSGSRRNPGLIRWIHCGLIAVALAAGVMMMVFGARQVNRFTDGKLTIITCGAGDQSGFFVRRGLSDTNEGSFRWTDGYELEVRMPYWERYREVEINIHTIGTFNGTQPYTIVDREGKQIAAGELTGAGEIVFRYRAERNEIAFTMRMPCAVVVAELVPGATDYRRVAFQIDRIEIKQLIE